MWRGSSLAGRGLGVLVDKMLNMKQQHGAAAMKADQPLGCICRGINSRDRDLIIPLYSALVRPHLEYCVQLWTTHFKKNMFRLERVQRRAMKIIKGQGNLPCEGRLKDVGFISLEERRLLGAMSLITVFQYLKSGCKQYGSFLFTRSPMEKTKGNMTFLFLQ